jgi:hypothetical protein
MNQAQIIEVLRQHGFREGRCIAGSKTGYSKVHPDHFAVFNAQIFSRRGRMLRQADLDLTRDADQLNAAARAAGENLYVLPKRAPHPFWEPGSMPMQQVLSDAVWWTRTRPQDEDQFLPPETERRRPKRCPLICTTGRWRGKPAYSLHWCGAVIEMCGHPPEWLRPERTQRHPNDPPFTTEPSATRGRPVRPVFYQKSGPFEFIWFSHGRAVPANLFDQSVGLLEALSYTWHKGQSAIHVRRHDQVIGLIWPCYIFAPEGVASARARLRVNGGGKSQEVQV